MAVDLRDLTPAEWAFVVVLLLLAMAAGYYLGRMACQARISHLLAQRNEILAEWEGGQDYDRVLADVFESEEEDSPLLEIAVAHTRKGARHARAKQR